MGFRTGERKAVFSAAMLPASSSPSGDACLKQAVGCTCSVKIFERGVLTSGVSRNFRVGYDEASDMAGPVWISRDLSPSAFEERSQCAAGLASERDSS